MIDQRHKRDSHLRQRHPFRLMLVFALAVAVGGVAGITFKEQQLADAFVGIDAAVSAGAVAELQSEVPFPAGFSRRRVHDDAETGIGALAQADHRDIGRNLHFFQGHTKAVGVGRKDEVVAVIVVMQLGGLQVGGIEALGIHHRARHVLENQEFLR